MFRLEVHQLSSRELEWPFHGNAAFARIKGSALWGRQYEVDPFPAYPHDADLVKEQLAQCQEFWPLGHDTFAYILDREGLGRTNASTYASDAVYDDGKTRYESYIVFAGKRIPPHPAMTRYLAWHEYGHCVEEWLEWMLYPEQKTKGKRDLLIREYAKLRGLEDNPIDAYGGRWHDAVTEVFACDFRWFAGAEREFWPHYGVPTPGQKYLLITWWTDMRARWLEHVKQIEAPNG